MPLPMPDQAAPLKAANYMAGTCNAPPSTHLDSVAVRSHQPLAATHLPLEHFCVAEQQYCNTGKAMRQTPWCKAAQGQAGAPSRVAGGGLSSFGNLAVQR